jgi:hypothetical protein
MLEIDDHQCQYGFPENRNETGDTFFNNPLDHVQLGMSAPRRTAAIVALAINFQPVPRLAEPVSGRHLGHHLRNLRRRKLDQRPALATNQVVVPRVPVVVLEHVAPLGPSHLAQQTRTLQLL